MWKRRKGRQILHFWSKTSAMKVCSAYGELLPQLETKGGATESAQCSGFPAGRAVGDCGRRGFEVPGSLME